MENEVKAVSSPQARLETHGNIGVLAARVM